MESPGNDDRPSVVDDFAAAVFVGLCDDSDIGADILLGQDPAAAVPTGIERGAR